MSPRVLVVDDDPALLEALPAMLRLRMPELEPETCGSAAEALQRLARTDYDAIVTDIKLPGVDGLALLAEIRRLQPETPTLLITGHGEHDLAVQALRGGAYDFIQKPIERDYFVASLDRAIQMRRLSRQVDEQKLVLERHARVLDHVGDGVFLVDEEGVIRLWNPAAAATTGVPQDAVVGRAAGDVFPGWDALAPLVPVASSPGESRHSEAVPLEFAGRELWLSLSGVRFPDGIVYTFRDLTKERSMDELKNDFVATVSHELRTPTAAIYGAAMTLARREELGEETQERLFNVVMVESERLARIVNEILIAGHLSSGNLELDRKVFDPLELVRDVVEAMAARVPDGLSVQLRAPESVLPISADPERLRQVLVNLVDNAVKYSPDGGRIDVGVDGHGAYLRISVRDEGLGIPPEEQERIFDKFYRLDPKQTRGIGGTGLGLYICRELVRRMEGRIWVASARNDGTTFFVELPFELAGRVAEPPAVTTSGA